jgi:hypothetical protein
MELPCAVVVLPHDDVLALVSNGVAGSEKSVSPNLDRRVAVTSTSMVSKLAPLRPMSITLCQNVRMAAVPRTKSLFAGSN